MDRRRFLTQFGLCTAVFALPNQGLSQGRRSWIEIVETDTTGVTGKMRIYETGNVEYAVVLGPDEAQYRKRKRFEGSPDLWARAEELLHDWAEGPVLKGDPGHVLHGPFRLPKNLSPATVRVYDRMGSGVVTYVQQEAGAGETVPDVEYLFERLMILMRSVE